MQALFAQLGFKWSIVPKIFTATAAENVTVEAVAIGTVFESSGRGK